MIILLALRRLLPLLAVLGFALAPVVAPAATAGMHRASLHQAPMAGHHHDMHAMDHGDMAHGKMDMAGGAMDGMPCCPKDRSGQHECGKGCPLMALCLSSVASLLPMMVAVQVPVGIRLTPVWPATASLASVGQPPLPEPPRA